jgi:hypothetical protein
VNRLLTGSLAYLLPTFPLGYLWHLTWFRAEYQALELYRSVVIIPFGLTSMIIQALIFSFIWLETGFTILQFAIVSPLLALVFREREAPALA